MRLLKLLKQYLGWVFVVLILLVVQSWCEISLPSYMSDIVNVGIQQEGIQSPVAPSLRAETAAGLMKFMNSEDAQTFTQAYSKPGSDGIMNYVGTDADADKNSDLAKIMQEAEANLTSFLIYQAQGMDPVSAAQKAQESASDNELISSQKALAFVKQELKDQGVDTSAIQLDYLKGMTFKMSIYALASLAAAIVAGLLASRISASVGRDLRHQIFERTMSFSAAEVNNFSQASLITRATNDVQQVQMTLVLLLRMIFLAPIMGAVAFFHVLSTDTGLTWIIGASILAVLGVVVVLLLLTMPRFKKMQSLIDRVNLMTRELLDGIMPIRAFGQQELELSRFDKASRDLMSTQLFTNRAMMLMMPMMMLIMNVTSVGIVWFGAHGIDAGTLQVGDMMAFISYAMMIIMSFLILSMVAVVVPRASVSAERIEEVLSSTSSITDPAEPKSARADVAPGTLVFENVSFSYPGATDPVISNVTFTATPGQTIGIVGSTGSGKTSLVQLIPRLYDVSEGAITLDGTNVKDYTLADLRSRIGYVPQQGFLFSGTIASNVSFGLTEEDDARVSEALRIAQAADFVAEKDDGVNSEISQGGSNVSGGQRQRLAIARALALQPEVLVLDDSFSALDYKTDKLLRHELAKSCANTTLVVVAARIASVMAADQILVLDDGQVVGQGTHQELLKNCPSYLEIAKSQLSAKELGLEEA